MRLDVFDNLSLTCPKAPFASLDSLLDEYTRTEFIDDYTCPKCSLLGTRKLLKPSSPMLFIIDKAIKMGDFEIELPKNVLLKVASKVSKQTWLAFLPQCVCLHMQRSVYTMSGAYKNNCRVQIPEMLDLSRFMNPIIDSEWIGGTDISTVPCGPPIHVQHEVKEQPSQESSPIIQSPSISANTKRAKKNRKLKKRKRQMRVDEIEKSALPRDQPTSPESIETAIEIHAFKSAMESFVRVQVPVFPAVISEPNPNLIYNLSSIILHYGSHHSGHFVTLRKIDAVWYRISDGQVHRIGDIPHETVSQYVYMAFYEREN